MLAYLALDVAWRDMLVQTHLVETSAAHQRALGLADRT